QGDSEHSKDADLSFMVGNWHGEWKTFTSKENGHQSEVISYSNLIIEPDGGGFRTTHKYYEKKGIGAPKYNRFETDGNYLDFWGRTYIIKKLKQKESKVSLAAVAIAHSDNPDKGKEWIHIELKNGQLNIKEVHGGENGLQKEFVLRPLTDGRHWTE
ncbi:MAG: hypothetical protein AAFV80_20085, partial [Bacteroidota bacterium]